MHHVSFIRREYTKGSSRTDALATHRLLHAVETRTSSPVRVSRDEFSLEAVGISGLFPAGEGAGFAGGIVSAAVDGMVVAEAVVESFGAVSLRTEKGRSRSASKNTGNFY